MLPQKKKNLRLAYLLLSSLSFLLLPFTSRAAESYDTLTFKPAHDQGLYLTVEESQTLGKWGYAFGLSSDFADNVLDLEDATGATLQSVIDRQLGLHLGGAIGLGNWFNIGVGVSGTPYQQFTAPGGVGSENEAKFGDVVLDAKIRLTDNETSALGIALVPFVTFPTGSDENFVGNGKITGGGKVVLDTARISDRVSFALNAGTQLRDEVTLSPGVQTVGHQFLYGAGVNVELMKPVQAVVEATGWTTFDNFFEDNNRNLEIDGAIKVLPDDDQRFQITAGGGAGVMRSVGVPSWRAFLSLAYHQPVKAEPAAPRVVEVPVPVPVAVPGPKEEVITTQDIHFAFNKAVIQPASHAALDQILSDIQNRPQVQSVRIEGHTDSVGSDEYNQQLSEKRAEAVRMYFINKGYPAEKLTAMGMGEGSPVADNTTTTGRAQNRRVEFHLQLSSDANVKVKDQPTSPTYEEGDYKKRR